MASITKRGNSWRVRVGHLDNTGTRRYRTKSFKTKKEASVWAAESEVEVTQQSGVFDNNPDLTFYDYFNVWYDTYKDQAIRRSTKRRYTTIGNFIQKYFADTPMRNVSRLSYQQFLNDYGSTHKRSTCLNIQSVINDCAASAVQDGVIRKNFASYAVVSGGASKSSDDKVLDLNDVSVLSRYLNDCLRVYNHLALGLLICLKTGTRAAEMMGLTWDCVSFDQATITIEKTAPSVPKGTENPFQPTKTPQSMRIIDIDDSLVKVLKRQKRFQQEAFLGLGIRNKFNLVCCSPTAMPRSNAFNDYLKKVLAIIGAHRIITMHGLRHTHASLLLMQGVSVYYISERLGHKNVSTTISTYSHLLQENKIQEIEKATQILAGL